jgi:hypothetical protein
LTSLLSAQLKSFNLATMPKLLDKTTVKLLDAQSIHILFIEDGHWNLEMLEDLDQLTFPLLLISRKK